MDSSQTNSIRNAVIRELGTGAADLSADIEVARKQALREIACYHKWSWLEQVPVTLTAGASVNYVTIPAYLSDEVILYQADSSRQITYISPAEWARLIAVTDSTTTNPDFHTVIDDRLYFYMQLPSAGTVTAIGSIDPDQVSDDDTNVISGIETRIPDYFRKPIIYNICEQIDTKEGKRYWRDLYEIAMAPLIDRDESKQGSLLKVQPGRAVLNAINYTHK